MENNTLQQSVAVVRTLPTENLGKDSVMSMYVVL